MKFFHLILAALMGVSLWLAYQFRPGRAIYGNSDDGQGAVTVLDSATIKFTLGNKDLAWPASEVFLGLAGVFALLMVALAIMQWRRGERSRSR